MGHGVGHHIDISIHALREEGDAGVFSQIVDLGVFLSTPSVRRATAIFTRLATNTKFLSTPSTRRATSKPSTASTASCNFYPRPPRGGRRGPSHRHSTGFQYFYPRPPRGGRRAELRVKLFNLNFYPRPP